MIALPRAPVVLPFLANVAHVAACAKVGRDPATLGRTVAVLAKPETLPVPGLKGRAGTSGSGLGGSSRDLAEGLQAFADAGVSHVQVVLAPSSMAQIERFGRALEILDRNAVV